LRVGVSAAECAASFTFGGECAANFTLAALFATWPNQQVDRAPC
jgi:hypothetical protein